MGSTRSVDMNQVVHLWNFILRHNSWVTTTHIPGILNEEADIESRKHETRTEWIINQKYFEKIKYFKPSFDLFATRLKTQLPHFVSLRSDPESSKCFYSFMRKLVILCFPTIALYPRGFTKGLEWQGSPQVLRTQDGLLKVFLGGKGWDLSQYMGRGWDASKKRENILLENVIFLLN